MANRDIGGKIRSKRSYTSSKPYDRRKSLFTKFTDTVKDIFVPSWLSDFMKNNPTENSQNTVIDEEDQNGNEIKDNDDNNYSSPHESLVVGDRRPAQPRPLHPEYTNYHQQVKAVSRRSAMTGYAADHMPSNHEMQYPPGPRYSTSNHDGSLPHAGQISETIPRLGDKQNCLSLTGADIEQLKNRLHPSADTQHPSDMNYQSTTASVDNDDDGNGSISADPEDSCDCESSKVWSNISYMKKNESDSFRTKPRFEPSLLVSPFLKDSLLSDSQHESSFYGGKTQYGGASSRRRMRLKESNPYSAATPYRRQVNAKPLHKNSTGAVTSSTAKRISDILEMMATPISDARKIPMNNHNTVLQFSPSNFKRRSRPSVAVSTFSSDSEKLPPRGPPTDMLNSPSKATIAKNRQSTHSVFRSSPTIENIQKQTECINKASSYTRKDTSEELARVFATTPQTSSVEKTTAVAATTTTSISTASVSLATASPSFFSNSMATQPTAASNSEASLSLGRPPISGKMKREKSYSTRGNSMKDIEDEPEEPVQLKTDFILPVTNVPKFSFGITTSSFSNQSGRSTVTPSIITTTTTTTSADKSNSGIAQSTATTSTITATPSFGTGTSFGASTSFTSSESDFTFSAPIQTTISDATLVSEGSPSVLDFKFSIPDKVIVDSAKHKFQFNASSILPKPKSTFIFEEKPASPLKTSASKPVESSSGSSSFGGIQPASTLKTGSVMDVLGGQKKETSKPQIDPLMAKFISADNWDCDTCMLLNKAEDKKCIACETPKPSAASTKAPTTTSNIVTDSLMAKFISSPNSWDCETCMLQNKPEATKCVACGASKPSSASQPKAGVLSQPDSLMAKFMPSSGSWDCDTCMLQNKAEATKCVACETPKPGCKPTLSTTATVVPTLPDKVDPLMAKFLKSDTWECSVCMLQNQESDSVCVACNTANPNAPPAPPSSSSADVLPKFGVITSTGFKFGAPSSSSDSAPISSAFKFGTSSTSDAAPISTGFKFGSDSAPISSGFKLDPNVSSAPSNGFKFGVPSSQEDSTKSESGTGNSSGFKFGFVPPLPGNKLGSDFKIDNSDDKKDKSDDQPKPASFVFSQPKSDGFAFSVKESTAPLTSSADPSTSNSGNSSSASCTTASAALPIVTPISTFPAAVSSSSSSGFCFTGTDKPVATGFKIPAPDTKTTSSAVLPTFSVSTEKSTTPIFGTAGSSDSTKSVTNTFIFGSDGGSKSTNPPSTGATKSPFSLASSLKRERDDETDRPSGAKRSVTSGSVSTTPAADLNFSAAAQRNAIFSGGFTSFTDSANNNPFSATTTNSSTASTSQQFQFGNSLPAFGAISSNSSSGSGANSGSSSTTAPSTFTSPGFDFTMAQTTASAPTVTTTTQSTPAFVFGSPASATSSPATFGATASTFQFRPANPTPPLFNSKPFSAATTTPATTNFTSKRSSEPFSFSNTGGVFQFTGKQSTDNTTTTAVTTAVNSNLFQFGQTPSANTNPGPLGTGTSTGFQFNSTPNFNFTSPFAFGGNSDSSQPQSGRVVKKAIRRARKV